MSGDDLFFTSATSDFLRELRDRSEKAIAGYNAELPRATGGRRAHLLDRIERATSQLEAIDAEFKRRTAAHA